MKEAHEANRAPRSSAADLRQSYDTIAREYAERISDELDGKPLDRSLLDELVDEARGRGELCDLGCGPGQSRAISATGELRCAGLISRRG